MKKYWLVLLVAVAASGCAANVDVSYTAPRSTPETGVVLVRFTEPLTSVSVRVDGVLVAEDKHTERIQVTGVPTGAREVTVVASESSRKESVHHSELVSVQPEKTAVVMIATPPRSTGYWINSGMTILAYGIVWAVMHPWHWR